MSENSKYNAYVSAVGHWMPEKVVPNKHFVSYLDTSDEWIKTRTGIEERRFLEDDQPTSYAAVKAVEATLKNRGITPDDIDVLIVATVTPDMIYPSTACVIQDKIGAKNCWGFDILAACSGFLFALTTGARLIESGAYKKVMVVGAEKMSAIVNMQDRNTCVLFGDGAAAFLLEPTEDKSIGILDSLLHIDGSGGVHLNQPAGGSLHPTSHETVDKGMQFVHQEGQAVYKAAVKGMSDISVEIMEKNNLKSDDVAFLVPHQANIRIIQACADRMKVKMDKVMLNIHKYGNTTSATIPSCVSEYYQAGKVKKDDYLILTSFGAGWTWGAILLKWAI